MQTIRKEISKDSINELYRLNFLCNSQEVILKLVSGAEDFNQELFNKEKSVYKELELERQILLDAIIGEYFSEYLSLQDRTQKLYRYSLDLSEDLMWLYLLDPKEIEE